MVRTIGVVLCVILATESFIICVGNAFTIYVFWNHRSGSLRRSCYLLLNLAVVDLLVGVTEPISLATKTIPSLMEPKQVDISVVGYILSALFVTFSISSVVFLAVISLERAFAVLRPLVHRTTSARVYIYSVAFIWVVGIALGVIYILAVIQLWRVMYSTTATNSVALLCLFIICGSYMAIRSRLKHSPQTFDYCQRRNMERNIKLSKTLFIVIALSISCWLSAVILYTVIDSCFECAPPDIILIGTVLHLGNSVVNPIAYSCRLPIFKKTLKRILKKREVELA